MKISAMGLELIKEFEGFSANAYLCPAKIPTIGYGNTFYANGTKVKLGEQISKTDALELLEKVVNKDFADKIFPLIKVKVSQNEFDAMVSLAYNIGVGNFSKSTLLKKLNSGDFDGASNEFLKWNKSGGKELLGLTKRRQREYEMFKNDFVVV
ncbi:lysozyme [Aliarcobacter cryaerophilus]|uniref:lysozyme n=1 Tax=Aliarcobacter cryaerophilus TaxID=28198 RepID=UPI0021B5BA14|nr:lysozyme [Aliarcobacter cryaerophilus]MCT7528833.1 lysozyme [Aliarcobacter cryaerophilus]